MSGIAGITRGKAGDLVKKMLNKMSYRGSDWQEIVSVGSTTIGLNGSNDQLDARLELKQKATVTDGVVESRMASASSTEDGVMLARDALGAAPLYYGWTDSGDLAFASEVKSLLEATKDVYELPAGTRYDGNDFYSTYVLTTHDPMSGSIDEIANGLRTRLEASIEKCIDGENIGSWLSGGLDSSIMAALASPHITNLHTFAGGLPNAPDIFFARQMAEHINSEHHEVILDINKLQDVLPEVIYHLETFDALLIRSSILNYLVAQEASQYVGAVFSGEGGDELFAGYEYLKNVELDQLPAELVDIIGRLHNTALQRVDRCASAHGTLPHLGFLDPDVVDYALRIPAEYKLHDGVEKWVLRQSVSDLLPDQILNRTKAKFWEGGGVEELLLQNAEEQVTTRDFIKERELPNGWILNSKEEMNYYRIFTEQFGEIEDLSWMGRTKGAPVT